MKTPLVFKLILLLVLAWRLIISNKKATKNIGKSYINLYDLPEKQLKKPKGESNSLDTIKRFYRDISRQNPEESQLYFMTYLVDKLQKHYTKRGIFRLFWFDQYLVIAFYQSLKILKLEEEAMYFEKILTNLSLEGFNKISEGIIPKMDIFLSENEQFNYLYENFDRIFDSEKYCETLITHFYEH